MSTRRWRSTVELLKQTCRLDESWVCGNCWNPMEGSQVLCCSSCGNEYHAFCLETPHDASKERIRYCYKCDAGSNMSQYQGVLTNEKVQATGATKGIPGSDLNVDQVLQGKELEESTRSLAKTIPEDEARMSPIYVNVTRVGVSKSQCHQKRPVNDDTVLNTASSDGSAKAQEHVEKNTKKSQTSSELKQSCKEPQDDRFFCDSLDLAGGCNVLSDRPLDRSTLPNEELNCAHLLLDEVETNRKPEESKEVPRQDILVDNNAAKAGPLAFKVIDMDTDGITPALSPAVSLENTQIPIAKAGPSALRVIDMDTEGITPASSPAVSLVNTQILLPKEVIPSDNLDKSWELIPQDGDVSSDTDLFLKKRLLCTNLKDLMPHNLETEQSDRLHAKSIALEKAISSEKKSIEAGCLQPSDTVADMMSIDDDVKVCDICGDTGFEDMLAVCSECNEGAEHTYCMRVYLDRMPAEDWICEGCKLEKKPINSFSQSEILSENPPLPRIALDNGVEKASLGDPRLSLLNHLNKGKLGDISRQPEGFSIAGSLGNVVRDKIVQISANEILCKRQADGALNGPPLKRQAVENPKGISSQVGATAVREVLSREGSIKNSDTGEAKFIPPAFLAGLGQQMVPNSSLGPTKAPVSLSVSSHIHSPEVQCISDRTKFVSPMGDLILSNLSSSQGGKCTQLSTLSSTSKSGSPCGVTLPSFLLPSKTALPVKVPSTHIASKESRESARKDQIKNAPAILTPTNTLAGKPPDSHQIISHSLNVEPAIPSIHNPGVIETISVLNEKLISNCMNSLEAKVTCHKIIKPPLTQVTSSCMPSVCSIRCYKCKEYSHSAQSCAANIKPRKGTSRAEIGDATPQHLMQDFESAVKGSRMQSLTPSCKSLSAEGVDPQDSSSQSTWKEAPIISKCAVYQTASEDAQHVETLGEAIEKASFASGSMGAVASNIAMPRNRHLDTLDLFAAALQSTEPLVHESVEVDASGGSLWVHIKPKYPPQEFHMAGLAANNHMDCDLQGCAPLVISNTLPPNHRGSEENINSLNSPFCQSSLKLNGQAKSLKSPVLPEHYNLWRGSFRINGGGRCNVVDGIQARPSNQAVQKVHDVTKTFQSMLQLEELPQSTHHNAWRSQFLINPPNDENIALYFIPRDNQSYERSYKPLVDHMVKHDLALKGHVKDSELFVFPSNQLPENSLAWNEYPFLWGVFRDKMLATTKGPGHVMAPSEKHDGISAHGKQAQQLQIISAIARGGRCDAESKSMLNLSEKVVEASTTLCRDMQMATGLTTQVSCQQIDPLSPNLSTASHTASMYKNSSPGRLNPPQSSIKKDSYRQRESPRWISPFCQLPSLPTPKASLSLGMREDWTCLQKITSFNSRPSPGNYRERERGRMSSRDQSYERERDRGTFCISRDVMYREDRDRKPWERGKDKECDKNRDRDRERERERGWLRYQDPDRVREWGNQGESDRQTNWGVSKVYGRRENKSRSRYHERYAHSGSLSNSPSGPPIRSPYPPLKCKRNHVEYKPHHQFRSVMNSWSCDQGSGWQYSSFKQEDSRDKGQNSSSAPIKMEPAILANPKMLSETEATQERLVDIMAPCSSKIEHCVSQKEQVLQVPKESHTSTTTTTSTAATASMVDLNKIPLEEEVGEIELEDCVSWPSSTVEVLDHWLPTHIFIPMEASNSKHGEPTGEIRGHHFPSAALPDWEEKEEGATESASVNVELDIALGAKEVTQHWGGALTVGSVESLELSLAFPQPSVDMADNTSVDTSLTLFCPLS